MKFSVILIVGLLVAGIAFLLFENQRMETQLQLAMSYQSQVQQLAEENVGMRLELEAKIEAMNTQINSAGHQLANLSNILQETKLKIDPNYDALLQQARDEVIQEERQRRDTAGRSPFASFSDPANARALAMDNLPRMYDSYLNALGIPGTERQQVMNAMVEFGTQRYQMLAALLEGRLTAEQANQFFAEGALSRQLETVLSQEQQAELRQYDLFLKQDTLQEVYRQELNRTGDAINAVIQDQIMQVLVDEILSEQNNYGALVAEDGSMLSAHGDKIAAFARARERLLPELNAEQLGQLDRFIDGQASAVDVILEASTDGNGRVSITQARVGVNDLPH